jgi:hypothetical protein
MSDDSDQSVRASMDRSGKKTSIALRLAVAWAVAATTLSAMMIGRMIPVPWGDEPGRIPGDWGWTGMSMPPQHVPRVDYLNRLAGAAEQWYRMDREDPLILARRVGELRQGCSAILLTQHRPLTHEDRVWLVEVCRSWAARCDGYLIALETGSEPRIIRGQVDRLIDEIAAMLRKQARSAPERVNPADRPPWP